MIKTASPFGRNALWLARHGLNVTLAAGGQLQSVRHFRHDRLLNGPPPAEAEQP